MLSSCIIVTGLVSALYFCNFIFLMSTVRGSDTSSQFPRLFSGSCCLVVCANSNGDWAPLIISVQSRYACEPCSCSQLLLFPQGRFVTSVSWAHTCARLTRTAQRRRHMQSSETHQKKKKTATTTKNSLIFIRLSRNVPFLMKMLW